MAALVDTNILVYRYDPRFPEKQRIATKLLRQGIATDSIRLPHQAIVEFVAVVTRPLISSRPLLKPSEARREAEEFLTQFTVLYPNDGIVRLRFARQLPMDSAGLSASLAYAEHYGLEQIISEDFQHDRLYGSVRINNPFLQAENAQ